LWNIATDSITSSFNDDGSSGLIAFAPDGDLIVGDFHSIDVVHTTTQLWDTTTGTLVGTLAAGQADGAVEALALGPDDTLAAGSDDDNTFLWNIDTGSLAATLSDPVVIPNQAQAVYAVAFAPDGLLAVGDSNGRTYLWNTASRTIVSTLTVPNGEAVDGLAFGPDDTLAEADSNGHTYLWHVSTGQ
jgi:WD40 repeat protein